MKNFRTILGKEFRRVFTDYRMYLALFLPGFLIFFVYTIIGNVVSDTIVNRTYEEVTYRVAYSDNHGSILPNGEPLLLNAITSYVNASETEKGCKVESESFPVSELSSYQDKLINGEFDIVIAFDDNFEALVAASSAVHPNISIYYNGNSDNATHLYQVVSSIVPTLYNTYTVNMENGEYIDPNISSGDSTARQVMSMIFPMVTITLLLSSVMSLCPESIAGEKERGTLTSLLITPTRRSDIVLAKITCLSVTSLLSGLVSFLGVALSLPKMMNGLSFTFPIETIIALFFLILSVLIFFVLIASLVSVLAKSVKEATGYLGPLMGVLIFLCILPSIADMSALGWAFVPLLNIATSMSLLITSPATSVVFFVCTILSNLVYSGLLLLAISKLFNNEKVVYSN
ncbi:MAG: ABC transporter permease [Candidatus Enteromonas sp.]